jgi:hypothetical protein
MGIFLSALLLVLVGGMTACSSHNGSAEGITNASTPTPAGTYTVTITARSQGALQATASFLLTVH